MTERNDKIKIESSVRLAAYTSWNIGGEAEHFCQPRNIIQIREATLWASENNKPVTILSGGSNVLISDRGVSGLVIHMSKFTGALVEEKEGRVCIYALSGTPKSELLKTFLRYKLAPALFLAGLPGDVGGGVVMNAGVSEMYTPREFVEIVDWIRVLRGQDIVNISRDELKWSYRHCHGWQPGIIVEVGISWPNFPIEGILERVKEANKTRLTKQPLDKPSCGSVFVNPEGGKAGQLIESSGLKGFRIGDAQVSEKHANFIVNLGNATAKDTWNLIQHIQKTVRDKTGFELKTEVVLMGEPL